MHDALALTRPSPALGGNRRRLRRWYVRAAAATAAFGGYSAMAAPAFAWPGCAC